MVSGQISLKEAWLVLLAWPSAGFTTVCFYQYLPPIFTCMACTVHGEHMNDASRYAICN